MTNRATRIEIGIILALGLLALLAGIFMMWFVAERVPHIIDEIAYIFQARVFARGQLWIPVPEHSRAFFTPFVVSVNEHQVGKYYVGWPLVLALEEVVGAGWLVPLVLNALTAVLIYLIGHDLYGRAAGLVGSLLAVTSPFALIQTSLFMSHVPAAFWVAVAMWTLLHADQAMAAHRSSRRWLAGMGFALGMLAITRPFTGLAASIPFLALLVARLIRQPGGLRTFIGLYWPLAAILPALLLQPLWLYLVTGNPATNLYTLVWPYDRVGFGPEFGRSGHTVKEGIEQVRRDLEEGWINDLYGLPGASWIPVGLGVVFGIQAADARQRFWPILFAGVFVLLVVFHIGYWIGGPDLGPRYFYEAHAGLAVLSGIGVCGAVRLVAFPFVRNHQAVQERLIYSIALLMISLSLGFYLPGRLERLRAKQFTIRRAPIDALVALVHDQPTLVLVSGERWRNFGALFSLNSPWYDGQIVAVHDQGAAANRRLIEDYAGRAVWYYHDGEFSQQPFPPAP